MRKIKAGKVNPKVIAAIARNYDRLKELCGYRSHGLFCSQSHEDIFQDTVLFVSQDKKASTLSTDKELLDYFCYRYRMIEYQIINDNKQLKEIPYADYLQTPEVSKEGEK